MRLIANQVRAERSYGGSNPLFSDNSALYLMPFDKEESLSWWSSTLEGCQALKSYAGSNPVSSVSLMFILTYKHFYI